jgi:D-serine deaminase-like pyridoxal phosphate-dependent protein
MSRSGHDAYFAGLTQALRGAGLARPALIVDHARMMANVDAAAETLATSGLPVRLVVKSLPAFGLLDPIAERLKTNRFMIFNGAMLAHVIRHRPGADVLLGKPLPAAEAAQFIAASVDAPPAGRPQWLVDTVERLNTYIALARAANAPIRVNFEIDVGLHRGGFNDAGALNAALEIARREQLVRVSGLMGYEPHIPKTPQPRAAFARAQDMYAAARDRLCDVLNVSTETLTLNSAGSPTYKLHASGTVANEVAIGSAFVKPLDFDLSTLEHHAPACFIATPVIKALDAFQLPSLEWLSKGMAQIDRDSARAFFIYGGHWLAQPVSPPGLRFNKLYGRSSNQELLTGAADIELGVDDFVFFRPTQSEAVFLQFGPIALYREGRIEMIETFPVSA